MDQIRLLVIGVLSITLQYVNAESTLRTNHKISNTGGVSNFETEYKKNITELNIISFSPEIINDTSAATFSVDNTTLLQIPQLTSEYEFRSAKTKNNLSSTGSYSYNFEPGLVSDINKQFYFNLTDSQILDATVIRPTGSSSEFTRETEQSEAENNDTQSSAQNNSKDTSEEKMIFGDYLGINNYAVSFELDFNDSSKLYDRVMPNIIGLLTDDDVSITEDDSYNSNNKNQEPFNFVMLLEQFLSNLLENDECRNHSALYLDNLRNYTMWAVKMLDATAKIPDGILQGNIRHLGNFDECLSVRAVDYVKAETFRGKYCLTNLHFTVKEGPNEKIIEQFLQVMTSGRKSLEITHKRPGNFLPYFALFEWAMCIPSSCTASDLQIALSKMANFLLSPRGLDIDINVDEESCYIQEPSQLHPRDFVMIAILLSFLMIIGIGSIYDLFYRERIIDEGRKEGIFGQTLVAFSVTNNWKKMMNMSAAPGTFHCLDGIRFLTMLWVIFTHEVFSMSREPWVNKGFLLETAEEFWKMPLQNSMLNVDTFFVIGGMLRSFNALNELDQHNFHYFSGFLQRYFRLTPAYGITLGFYATLLAYVGNGPTWNHNIGVNSERCRNNWGFNMLYINNYIDVHNMCMPHSWYLAADMQLFLVAPFIIYPIWKWKNFGKWLLGLLLLISIGVLFFIILVNRYLGVQSAGFHDTMLQEYTSGVYLPTHMRTTSYIVGLGLGYIFYKLQEEKQFKLEKFWVATGWIVCLITLFLVVFGPYKLMIPGSTYQIWDQTFYGAFHRFAWALAISWIIFTCHKGYGGLINSVLSMRILRPLSRLTFSAYLVHFAVVMVGTSKIRTAYYMDDYFMIQKFLGDTVVSIVISAILFLGIEQPFLILVKMIFHKIK
ncbi:hypothetical protein C0J52_12694 [Blattella germanica]|nr:hypothetical protein C0J52_12694 [Blattella germanica]